MVLTSLVLSMGQTNQKLSLNPLSLSFLIFCSFLELLPPVSHSFVLKPYWNVCGENCHAAADQLKDGQGKEEKGSGNGCITQQTNDHKYKFKLFHWVGDDDVREKHLIILDWTLITVN